MLKLLRLIAAPFVGLGFIFWLFIGIPFKDGKYIAYSSVLKETEKERAREGEDE